MYSIFFFDFKKNNTLYCTMYENCSKIYKNYKIIQSHGKKTANYAKYAI